MTTPTPGSGFRIATGFLKVVADDKEARKDTDRFLRDTDRKMATGGHRSGGIFGRNFGLGMFTPLLAGVKAVAAPIADIFKKALAAALKLTAFAAIAGVVTSAIGGIGAALYQLIPAIVELGQVAITASGALLLIPGAIATGIAALVTFKLGLNGINAALKAGLSGDVEKFNEALKKLAPNAAGFVREMVKLKPAFDKLRLNIQQQMFANTAKTVKDLGKTLLPALMIPLVDMARVLNGALRDGLLFLNETATRLTLARTLAAAAEAAGNLGGTFRPLLRIVTDVTLVSARMFAQFTGGAAGAMNRWADSISSMAQSGALAELITGGLDALKQFGSLALDILGIFKGIFAASGSGGFFAFFDRLNTLINSASGQSNLKAIFGDLERIGTALAPVLAALLAALVPVVDAIATISIAFAPGLQALISGLGTGLVALVPGILAVEPVLRAVGAALPMVGQGLSTLVSAFAPGALALLNGLAQALTVLAINAGPLGEALGNVAGALGGVLVPVAQILADLIINLAPGVKVILDSLAVGLSALAPAAAPVAQAISAILIALAPLLPLIGELAGMLLTVLATELSGLVSLLAPVIKGFALIGVELLSRLAPVLSQLVTNFLPVLATMLDAVTLALTPLLPLFVEMVQIFAEKLGVYLPQIIAMGLEMIPVFQQVAYQLGVYLLKGLTALMPYLPALIDLSFQLMMAFLRFAPVLLPLLPTLMELALMFQAAVIKSGLLRDVIYLLEVGIAMLLVAVTAASAVMGAWVAVVQWVAGVVRSFGTTVRDTFSAVKRLFSELGSTITSAVGNLGGLLYNAGRSLIDGLLRGIRAAIPGLDSLLGWITSKLPSWKGPLDVDRRILEPSGRAVMAGFQRGLESSYESVRRSLGGLTMAMPAMAGGGGTSVSVAPPVVHVTVMMGEREMESLVEGVLVAKPQTVAASTDVGHQQRAFLSTRNRLIQRSTR